MQVLHVVRHLLPQILQPLGYVWQRQEGQCVHHATEVADVVPVSVDSRQAELLHLTSNIGSRQCYCNQNVKTGISIISLQSAAQHTKI